MLPWHARSVIDTFHTLQDHKTDKYGQTVEHPKKPFHDLPVNLEAIRLEAITKQ